MTDFDILESLLEYGIMLFKRRRRNDDRWRLRVLDGKEEFSQEIENCIIKFYNEWLMPCELYLAKVERLEKDGHVFYNAEKLRKCLAECRAITTPDAEYFTELHDLRDEAIDEFRAGTTEPFD